MELLHKSSGMHSKGIEIPGFHKFPCLRQVRDMVLGQILQLYNAAAMPHTAASISFLCNA